MSVDPEGFDWRSPVYRRLAAAGARFAAFGDAAVAESIAEPAHEAERARRLALADLSPLGRIGFKGPGALDWLHAQGVTIGEEDNRAWRQTDGALSARLAPTEAVILDSVHAPGAAARLAAAWSIDAAGCHLVHRRDAVAWFVVTGAAAAAMFAKLCAVDLRPHRFPARFRGPVGGGAPGRHYRPPAGRLRGRTAGLSPARRGRVGRLSMGLPGRRHGRVRRRFDRPGSGPWNFMSFHISSGGR